MSGGEARSANFEFLKACDGQLYRLAALGERYFRNDPNTCVVKLRQFAELMAKDVGARAGLLTDPDAEFVAVLGAIGRSGYLPLCWPSDLLVVCSAPLASGVSSMDHQTARRVLRLAQQAKRFDGHRLHPVRLHNLGRMRLAANCLTLAESRSDQIALTDISSYTDHG
ncbi:MAG TPA: hypothetical protein VN814_10205 [Caulobacteraceae bacterium]|nr:hypothetical protein [Caulobacteraceae bacterium]